MVVNCKECGKSYPNAKKLSPAHVKKSHDLTIPQYEQKHGQYSSVDPSLVIPIEDSKRITCGVCGFEFTNVITVAHLNLHGITKSKYIEQYGDMYSQFEKLRRSEAITGERNPLYGAGHTEETREKISQTTTSQYQNGRTGYFSGKEFTEEHRQKLREAKLNPKKDQ